MTKPAHAKKILASKYPCKTVWVSYTKTNMVNKLVEIKWKNPSTDLEFQNYAN